MASITQTEIETIQNCKKALERAMTQHYDGNLNNYYLIVVEGYKCIAHSSDTFEPIILDEIIVPFDDKQVYPIQGLETTYAFKRYF